jgi:glucosyl-dolichyl phosphate glucuronosyltransferase
MREFVHSVGVVVCAYTMQRWSQIERALESLRGQTVKPREIILVIDHNLELLERARRAFPWALVVENLFERGLSGARNSGVAKCSSDIVAFLDDDARAEPQWLETLLRHYGGCEVLGVGGTVRADWVAPRPSWFPREFDWVVGCSYAGQPARLAAVRNPIGAAMSFRRDTFHEVGGFHAAVGRVGTMPTGCEETEFAIRVRRRWPMGKVLYDPAAVVDHEVTQQRTTFVYFARRCWGEGISKAAVSRLAHADGALAAERNYVTRTLPSAVLRELACAARQRQVAAVARAATLSLGLLVTAAGYARGLASTRKTAQPPSIC